MARRLLKRLVPRTPWRVTRNLAAALGLLPSDSGTYGGQSAEVLVEGKRRQVREALDFGSLLDGGLNGKAVLELGPGNNLIVALLLLGAGARQVVSIDRFRSRPDVDQQKASYEALHQSMSPAERGNCQAVFSGGPPAVSTDLGAPLVYLWDCGVEGAEERLGAERFDLIVSNSVLEHVSSVTASFESMQRLLKPGARMYHRVDLRSHEEDEQSHPLEFLTHTPLAWKLMTSHTGEPNRVRQGVYRQLLQDLGFETERFEETHSVPEEQVRAIQPRLARPFRDLPLEELMNTGFRFVARKGPAPA